MKTKQSGYLEKKINGKIVPISFGTNAFDLLTEMYESELDDVEKILSRAGGVRDLIFCGMKAAALSADKEFTLNKYQVGDWLDELPQEDYADILSTLEKTKVMGQDVKVEEKKV